MLTNEDLDLVRTSLFAGHYHLLLGSGISMDSKNGLGETLKSAGTLATELSVLKGLDPNTPLSRVSMMLDDKEVDKYITKPYSSCRAGDTVKQLTSFIWKSIFTFNIDDALEAAYENTTHPKQNLESINFDENYKTAKDKSQLLAIHLHGFTRQSEKKYVFSSTEYARVTRGMNAWMHVLSEIMASEPFIISGTSLSEPDLDYYLAGRTEATARANRGPSLLIEPYPNKLTELLCQRHGLILVKASLSEFLIWISEKLGRSPSVGELTIPSISGIFKPAVKPDQQIVFFSEFELVRRATSNPEGEISPFHFGKSPRWSDLESLCDIPTPDEQKLAAQARNWLAEGGNEAKLICLLSEAGSGKTTILRRTAYELSKEGHLVFHLLTNAAIDADNVIKVLSETNHPVTIIIDGLAGHAPSLRAIMTQLSPKKPILFICADRDYRKVHIERVIGDLNINYQYVEQWNQDHFELLIEKLFNLGLLAQYQSVHHPKRFANQLLGDTVAIATCRALNNFKPLETIVKSVWRDATSDEKRSYAIASLAEHCYDGGIYYPILEKSHPNSSLRSQLQFACPLPLTYADDTDYVFSLHPVVADRLLSMLSREKPDWLLDIFSTLANALAPHVNRKTTISRTPEAKLASRLFSSEKVVRPLLGIHAATFFDKSQPAWKWNPRYWEQRALLTQTSDIELAIQYARHAVAIEEHPFPWTTLASLLVKKLDIVQSGHVSIFSEVIELLKLVTRHERASRAWRPTPHPYVVLFHAVSIFLNFDGKIPPKDIDWLEQQMDYCERIFGRDKQLMGEIEKIKKRISHKKI